MTLQVMRNGLRVCSLVAAGTVAALAVSNASAAPIVNISMTVGGGVSGTVNNSFPQATNVWFDSWGEADQTDSPFPGGINDVNGEWRIDTWLVQASDDPSFGAGLYSTFEVWNTSQTNTLHFSLYMDVDVATAGQPTSWFFSGGLVLTPGPQGGLLTTTNFFNPGSDLVTMLLDGVAQQTYFPSGYSISGNDSDSDFDGPVLLGVTATNIGIRFDFALSPGAKAQVTGSIDYLPAPAGLAIFGLAGMLGRRRRRD